jgi:L-fuconolactonase
MPGTPFTVAGVRPVWEVALELFGPERLMWGSDWPMTLLTSGYAGTWEVMRVLIEELAPAEQEQLLAGTATRVYGLPAPAVRQETRC